MIAFIFGVAGLVIPIVMQVLLTLNYKLSGGGVAAWGIAIFLWAAMGMLVGWGLGIPAIVMASVSLKKKYSRGFAISALIIGIFVAAGLPLLLIVVSYIVGW